MKTSHHLFSSPSGCAKQFDECKSEGSIASHWGGVCRHFLLTQHSIECMIKCSKQHHLRCKISKFSWQWYPKRHSGGASLSQTHHGWKYLSETTTRYSLSDGNRCKIVFSSGLHNLHYCWARLVWKYTIWNIKFQCFLCGDLLKLASDFGSHPDGLKWLAGATSCEATLSGSLVYFRAFMY